MNAADREQDQLRKRQADNRQAQFVADLRAVLVLPAGRRAFWEILQFLEPGTQMWATNAAVVGFNASRYDVAVWIKEWIDQADEDALLKMMSEARLRSKQIERERAARELQQRKRADNENDSAFGDE